MQLRVWGGRGAGAGMRECQQAPKGASKKQPNPAPHKLSNLEASRGIAVEQGPPQGRLVGM